jgi:hypothetical protein
MSSTPGTITCSSEKKDRDSDFKKKVIAAISTVDQVITGAAKDLPIAKLYQILKVGATIAVTANNVANAALSKALRPVIIKLIKIFNTYLYILRAIIIATKDDKPQIYNLDMTEIEEAMDDFNEVMVENPPANLLTRLANLNGIVKKYEDVVDKLSLATVQGLSLLTSTLYVDDTLSGIKYKLKESDEFKAMYSPLSSDNCGDFDIAIIFQGIRLKITALQAELENNTKYMEGFRKNEKAKRHEEAKKCPGGILQVIPGFGQQCKVYNVETGTYNVPTLKSSGGSKKSKRKKRNKRKTKRFHKK